MSSSNGKPKAQVVGLKTLDMRAQVPGFKSVPQRPHKKRVFTEDEWSFLNGLPTQELYWRIGQGRRLIGLLYRPEMLNMTRREADRISSNLRYQIEAIESIITARSGPKE